jgi:hypothetical protein
MITSHSNIKSRKSQLKTKRQTRLERRAACTPEKLYAALADLYWLERNQYFDFVVKQITIRDELGFTKEDFNKVYRSYRRDLRGAV